jgi:anti-sigma regulatory factor (Ser/Thr protein kinase)
MLMLDYKPKDVCVMNKTFPAKTAALHELLAAVEQTLEGFDCSMKLQTAICVALEEVFVNVAHYAYPEGQGDVNLRIDFNEHSRVVTFRMTDKGIPFDPLQKPDPDLTLSVQDRQIGGFGIFITKKTMDNLCYAYENGENILTMTKKI